MNSPRCRVLGAYEMLESILICLPIKDLFVIQRVSRNWKSIIEQSHTIRKKKFLLADGSPIPPHTYFHDFYSPGSTAHFYRGCVQFNPAFKFVHLCHPDDKCISWASYRVFRHEPCLTGTVGIGKPGDRDDAEAFFVPEATCRSMLVTQPPVVALSYNATDFEEITADGIARICDVYNPQGITFGDLYTVRDKVIDAWEKQTGKEHLRLDSFDLYLKLPAEDPARKDKFEPCSVPEDERKGGCLCIKALLEAKAPWPKSSFTHGVWTV